MAKNLPVWLLLTAALVFLGIALLPLLRVALGIDAQIGLPFLTTVMLLIGGLMSGLSAMILLVRRVPPLSLDATADHTNTKPVMLMHASGLLLYTGIPLLNFLVAYWLWVRFRHENPHLNWLGREVLNFQVTIYLYLLLSLFMVFAAIGVVTTPLLLVFHLAATLYAIAKTSAGRAFTYPANIPIIQGRRAPEAPASQ